MSKEKKQVMYWELEDDKGNIVDVHAIQIGDDVSRDLVDILYWEWFGESENIDPFCDLLKKKGIDAIPLTKEQFEARKSILNNN